MKFQNIILDNADVENKIQRIGLEILEDNLDESKITLFGISDNGNLIAQKLLTHINGISDIEVESIQVEIENGSITYNGKFNIFCKLRARSTDHAKEIIFAIDDIEGVNKTETMISLEESINDKKRLMHKIFNEL